MPGAGPIAVSVRPVTLTGSPGDIARRIASPGGRARGAVNGADGLVVLTGGWAGGGAMLAIDPIDVVTSAADPFGPLTAPIEDIPADLGNAVGGGWFGWIGFDRTDGPDALPSSRWALYPNVLRYDAAQGQWFDEALTGLVEPAELARRRRDLLERAQRPDGPQADPPAWIGPFAALTGQDEYERAVHRCIEHIRAGDIYQANICLALQAETGGPPLTLYRRLIQALHPRFGAYLTAETGAVLSASPELFLRRQGRSVLSSPIKGTRPRPADAGAAALGRELRQSVKDRAENVMIVDMVRNDVSRVAVPGSVRVPALLRLEPHPGVWHLVSDVSATLADGADDADLVRASFPPGSVTGAPKVRAMEIIENLESTPRGLYTGAIGYRSPVAGLELSVAIRTVQIVAGRARLGVGAGITAGSDPTAEWEECLHKARPIVAGLGAGLT